MSNVTRALVASPITVDDIWKDLACAIDKYGAAIVSTNGPVLATRILDFDFAGETTTTNPNPPPPYQARLLWLEPFQAVVPPDGWEAASLSVTSWQAWFTSVENPPANLLQVGVLACFDKFDPNLAKNPVVRAGAQLVDWCWPSKIQAHMRVQVTFFGAATGVTAPIAISPQLFGAADQIATAQVPIYLVQGPNSRIRRAQVSIATLPVAAEVISITLQRIDGTVATAISNTASFAPTSANMQEVQLRPQASGLAAGTILRADITAPSVTAAKGLLLTVVLDDSV